MRPILRPGCHVLRRDEHEIQVGLDPEQAVVLPDTEAVRRCLGRLHTWAGVPDRSGAERADEGADTDDQTLDLLLAGDLLVDGDLLLPLIPSCTTATEQPSSRPGIAALARSAGDDAARLVRQRGGTRVAIAQFGHACGGRLCADLRCLLQQAGLRSRSVRPGSDYELAVLVGVGEPPRELLDGWVRDGKPHLVLRLSEGSATVGPFVQPGETACLRCVDAHHTDADPSWPLLVEQYSRLTRADRADGIPEPVDVLAASVAVSWAARDLASYAEGRQPSTWSSTLRFDPHLTAVETRSWLRHPACGCAWG